MRRESNFYLLVSLAQLATMLFVAVSWTNEDIQNTFGVIILKICFFVLALVVLAWSATTWAKLHKQENDERTNKKD